MNQEQNNLNPNNFNTQGYNGTPNNQPLNNQSFNQQQINPQPQPIPNFQQPIEQMNMQQPTPQPMNSFDIGSTNNQSFNIKPPKKMNLGLIIGIVAAVVVVGVGIIFASKLLSNESNNNNSENSNNKQNVSVENYDVDLKQLNFNEVDDLYMAQVKGSIIQNIRGSFTINGEYYDNLFLTEDGSLYFLSNYSDNLIKIDHKTNLKYIDGLIGSDYSTNPLIYGNGLFYSLTENGNLEVVDNKNIIYPIGIRKDDHFIGITKDKKLTAVLSCKNYDKNNTSGKCDNTSNWITVKSEMDFNYASSSILISSENKLYSSKKVYSYISFDYKNMLLNISQTALTPILENVVNYYDIDHGQDGNSTLFQTSDNKIHIFGQDLILASIEKAQTLNFNAKIEKIYGSGDYEILLSTGKTISLLKCEGLTNCKWQTIDLTNELIEYKDKIRNFGTYYYYGEEYFVLLTNGNLYELNVD